MSGLLLRWRVPDPPVALRWRGPQGMLEAIARAPLPELAGFVPISSVYTAEGPGLSLTRRVFSLDYDAIGDELGLPALAAALDAIPEYTASGDGLKLDLGQFSLDYGEISEGLGLPAFAAATAAAFAAIPNYTVSGNGIELTAAQFSLNYGEIDTGLGLTANFAPKASPVFSGIVTAPQIVAPTLTLGDAGVANRIYLDGTKTSIVGDVDITGVLRFDANDVLAYDRANNRMQAWIGGTVRLQVDGAGNVGIGTIVPSYTLDVYKVGAAFTRIASDGSANLWLSSGGSSSAALFFGTPAGSAPLVFQSQKTGVGEVARINADGKVGVGTASPDAKLDIVTGVGTSAAGNDNCFALRHQSTVGNAMTLQMGVSTVAMGDSNQGHSFIQSHYWGGGVNPLLLQPLGGSTLVGGAEVSAFSARLTVRTGVAVKAADNTVGVVSGRFGFNPASASYRFQPAFMGGVFDKAFWFQGMGLVFHTIAGADISGNDGTERMRITSDGAVGIGNANPQARLHVAGNIIAAPPAIAAPSANGEMTFEFTTNTTLKIKARGTDGVVREASLALA